MIRNCLLVVFGLVVGATVANYLIILRHTRQLVRIEVQVAAQQEAIEKITHSGDRMVKTVDRTVDLIERVNGRVDGVIKSMWDWSVTWEQQTEAIRDTEDFVAGMAKHVGYQGPQFQPIPKRQKGE